jgi:alpha,alpha-trehalase
VDIVLRCVTGLRARGEVLWFDPALPPQVKQLNFSIHYRHHRLDIELGEDHLQLSSRPGEGRPIQIHVRDQTIHLVPGARHEFSLQQRP